MSSDPAREILVTGARALAHADELRPTLEALLGALTEQLDIDSAAIVAAGSATGGLEIIAAVGLGEPAAAGLVQAMRNPAHPIARTFAEPSAAFDVQPMNPGGPALRSHVPLAVTRGGSTTVLGVLALAHERPLVAEGPLIEAASDLVTVALERDRLADGRAR